MPVNTCQHIEAFHGNVELKVKSTVTELFFMMLSRMRVADRLSEDNFNMLRNDFICIREFYQCNPSLETLVGSIENNWSAYGREMYESMNQKQYGFACTILDKMKHILKELLVFICRKRDYMLSHQHNFMEFLDNDSFVQYFLKIRVMVMMDDIFVAGILVTKQAFGQRKHVSDCLEGIASGYGEATEPDNYDGWRWN